MATLGTITQLPKDFFLHAATLAGAASEIPLAPDQQVESETFEGSVGSSGGAERCAGS